MGVGRLNVGNQITNGMQILSVGATTASGMSNSAKQRRLADATSGLNNLSEEDLNRIGSMNASKKIAEVERYEAGGGDIYQHMTPEQAARIQKTNAKKTLDQEKLYRNKGASPFQHGTVKEAREYQKGVADKMFGRETVDDVLAELDSEQKNSLALKIKNNITYTDKRKNKEEKEPIQELIEEEKAKRKAKGGDKNADN